MSLKLRRVLARALTNNEVDDNFVFVDEKAGAAQLAASNAGIAAGVADGKAVAAQQAAGNAADIGNAAGELAASAGGAALAAQETADTAGEIALEAKGEAAAAQSTADHGEQFIAPLRPFLEPLAYDESTPGEIVTDGGRGILSSTLPEGKSNYLKRLVDNFNGQRVEFLPADEFELSGVHDAVVDEDRRILTAIPGAVPPPGHYLPLTGGDLTGPLGLHGPAGGDNEAVPLSQVESLIADATRPILRRGTITCAIIGDSRVDAAFVSATRSTPRSFPFWAELYSGGALRFPGVWDFGVSGERTDQILPRIGDPIGTDADVVVILASVNDGMEQDSIGNLQAMVDAVVQAGKVACIIAEYPRGDDSVAWGSTRKAKHRAIHQAILAMASQPGVRVVNPMPELIDPARADGGYKAGLSYDGVHTYCIGAMPVGKLVVDALADLWQTPAGLLDTNADTYDATYNPAGNHVANGMMFGIGGTLSGSGSPTGQVADGWAVSSSADFAVVASKVTKDGYDWQQVEYAGTPTNTAQVLSVNQAISAADFTAGDTIEFLLHVEVDDGAVNSYGPEANLYISGVQTALAAGWQPGASVSTSPEVAYSGIYRSQQYTFSTAPTSLELHVRVNGKPDVLSSGTFRVSRVSLRKIQ